MGHRCNYCTVNGQRQRTKHGNQPLFQKTHALFHALAATTRFPTFRPPLLHSTIITSISAHYRTGTFRLDRSRDEIRHACQDNRSATTSRKKPRRFVQRNTTGQNHTKSEGHCIMLQGILEGLIRWSLPRWKKELCASSTKKRN